MIENCSWFPFSDEPVVRSLWYVPRFSSPKVILPSDSPDGRWHMFVDSVLGIHHFISDSGIAWEPNKVVVARGHYPSIYKENGKFYLVYEVHGFSLSYRQFDKSRKNSKIGICSSDDLFAWSEPRIVLDGENVSYADFSGRKILSFPQIVKMQSGLYRLYFSASVRVLPDSKQKVGKFFGYAEATDLDSEFTVPENSLLLKTSRDDKCADAATGSISLFTDGDIFYGLQCGYFWDEVEKRTSSAVFLLKSKDGNSFERCSGNPLIMPQSGSWAGQYIRSCSINYMKDENCFYCYFSACGEKESFFLKESIGLFIGNPRQY